MKVFITGATGWVGSGVVRDLVAGGHTVVGLSRSESGADKLAKLGATALAGSIEDTDVLATAAGDSDAVVHLAYDMARPQVAGGFESAAITAMCDALAGTDRPFLFSSATGLVAPGRVATESDSIASTGADAPRGGAEQLSKAYAEKGVRTVALRFPATVHGDGDVAGFIPQIVRAARRDGVIGYVGDGANRWPATHRDDVARAIIAAIEKASAGSAIHPVAEQGVATKDFISAIGDQLGLPVESITAETAVERLGFPGRFLTLDLPASGDLTREHLNWEPREIGLLDDIATGHYARLA